MAYIGQTPTAVALDGDDLSDDIITLAKMAAGTDGNIISYDASGNPVAIATGTDGQVLTSAGAGAAPAFEALPAGGLTSDMVTTTYDVSTASGTQDITGFGFNPTCCTITGVIGANKGMSIGWCDSSATQSVVMDYHLVTADAFDGETGIAVKIRGNSGNHAAAVVSYITDGIRLTWTKTGSPTGTAKIYVTSFL
jgi:hypothetical protein